jgi:ubiquinone biosynthesis protein UbiJ
MVPSAAAAVANHLLDGQPWLRERLQPFAGRTLEIRLPVAALVLTVGPDGRVAPAAAGAQPDAVAALAGPPALADLLRPRGLMRAVELHGDGAFAAAVAGVLDELRWDAEEDLSRWVGDIAARRMVQTGVALLAWPRQAALNLAASASEYVTEEQRMLASRAAIDGFLSEVDSLREAVDRLEKRIERLSGQ